MEICANIRYKLEGKNDQKFFLKVLERHNLQNQTIRELYADDDKLKYSSNPNDISNLQKKKKKKKKMKNFRPSRQLPKLLLLNLSAKFLTEKNI